jgi:hypothetical protein
MRSRRLRIGVIGKNGDVPEKIKEIAEKVGEEIAKNGAILICGGREGVMEAACRGAKKEKGTTVGILPSLDESDANKYVDVVITTGMNYARNVLVVTSSDVVIAIEGSVGTLSEISLALNYQKPVVVVKGSGGISDEIQNLLKKCGKKFGKKPRVYEAKAEEAVKMALKLIS